MQYSPLQNQSLFWGVNLDKLDLDKNKEFIISRILENGTKEDIDWLRTNFTDTEIKDIVIKSKLISRKTAYFWKIILDIKEDILCLSDQFRKTQKTLWIP